MNSISKFVSLLSRPEKRKGILVVGLIILMAASEMLGVASIVPFLNVVGNPEKIETNSFLAKVHELGGFQDSTSFLIFLGVLAFLAISLASTIRIATQFVINKYVHGRRHSLALKLLRIYLGQPYEFFLNRHSSDIAKVILSEVDGLVSNFLRPLLEMLAHGAVVLVLLALLIVTNPVIALAAVLTIGGFYSLTFWLVRRIMGLIGVERLRANKERYRSISDASASIKVVKLAGDEDVFIKRFKTPSYLMAKYSAQSATLLQIPRYAIETVAIGGVILVVIVLMMADQGGGPNQIGDMLPVLGLYAFAGYRLLPSAQQLYSSFSSMRLGKAALDDLYQDMQRSVPKADTKNRTGIALRSSVVFKNVKYTYPGASRPALSDVSVSLPAGRAIAVTGHTGAGKTTFIDLLLGLLRPDSGAIYVDGKQITSTNLSAWQQSLAYVPQEIVLLDNTVRENIAFGVLPECIDDKRVEASARVAMIHDFIVSELSSGYETSIGERGIRLSGGQRQRIGIARALYRQPTLLVLDEATNALDESTEARVLSAIRDAHPEWTIIIVSHRQTTMQHCDDRIHVDRGNILVDHCRFASGEANPGWAE